MQYGWPDSSAVYRKCGAAEEVLSYVRRKISLDSHGAQYEERLKKLHVASSPNNGLTCRCTWPTARWGVSKWNQFFPFILLSPYVRLCTYGRLLLIGIIAADNRFNVTTIRRILFRSSMKVGSNSASQICGSIDMSLQLNQFHSFNLASALFFFSQIQSSNKNNINI